MADRSVRVILSLIANGFEAGMAKAKASTDQLIGSLDKHSDSANKVANSMMGVGAAALAGVGVVTKAALDWESAWAGVAKTVDGTASEMAALEGELRSLATTLPATHAEIAGVAEAAGQLGIAREDVAAFTKTMIDLGETTNLTADEAATSLAQFMNVMGTSASEVANLGSAIVALGNDGASTEKQIVEMAQRIAAAGRTVGMSEADVLGFASALSSVGVEAEAGGTAISQTFTQIAAAVREGGAELKLIAKTAGMTAQEFARAWAEDPARAVQAFVEGLGEINRAGGDAYGVLEDLGMSGIRQADSIMRLANAGGLLGDSLDLAGESIETTAALSEEAAKRYATTESQITTAMNNIKDAAITLGTAMLPVVAGVAQDVAGVAQAFSTLPAPVQQAGTAIAAIAGVSALAVGGLMKITVNIAETVTAFNKLSAGVKGASLAIGGVGAILAIAGAQYASIASEQAKAAAAADEFAGAMQGQVSAINDATRAVAAKQLQDSGAFEAARKLGINLDLITDAALGSAAAQQAVAEQTAAATQRTDEAYKSAAAAGESWKAEAAAAREMGAAATKLTGELGAVTEASARGVEQAREMGEATRQSAAAQAEAAAQFQAAASATGVSAAAAANLAVQYGLLPAEVATEISAPGADVSKQQVIDLTGALVKVPSLTEATLLAPGARPSKADVDAFIASVGSVPGLTEAEIRTIADLYGVEAAKRAIASVQGKSVEVVVNYRASGAANLRPIASAYATGGHVRGPGTGTSDSIPAMLSNGEYVIREAAVRRLGLKRLDWLNAYGELPKFASGGYVGAHYAPAYTPPSRPASASDGAVSVSLAGATIHATVDGTPLDMRIEGISRQVVRAHDVTTRRVHR